MARTDWSQVVYDKQLATAKSVHKKLFVTQKILASELPEYIDAGWEKCKDYKSPKYVGIAKEKPVDEQFEDRIWLMFAGMGFYGLNAENGILISYDFSNDDLKERIGVLAVDDETALVGLCHASEAIIEKSFAAEITAFSDKISGIRKEVLKQFPGRKLKFIWASHNFIMNRRDLALLDKAGMAYFSDTTVEYYTDLAKHLGSCSRYQLLGSLFANQEIKNMDDKVPAIQGKMGGYTYYSFSIEPEKLLKIGYVLHRSEANKNMMPTYQRLIKKKRLQEVRSFINDGGYFPNSIIISIDTNGKGLVFDQSASKVDSTISKIGILHIPKRYRSAYIIDGQHRLYGYSDSLYAETNTIPVVAFVDLERSEQIKLFMDINENQKAVPKSLRVTLNADMLWESPDFSEQRQALRSKIAQMLGEESTSPLNSRIVIGENESTPTRCISSFSRICARADAIEDFSEPLEDVLTKAFAKLTVVDSRRWISFLLDVLPHLDNLDFAALPDAEKRMMQMFYVTVWGKTVENWDGEEVLSNLYALSDSTVLLGELLELLRYRFEQIDFIDEPVDLGFDCPLDLHCTYTRDQLLVALDFMKPSTVREGVKWLPEKNIDVFFVTLNKADKDYSPTTMYNDYSISESLFHWQSQSTTAENSPTGQRYIHHKERGSKVLLFVREFKADRMTGGAEAYTYLGTANYVKHEGSRPMNITWQLDRPIPAKFLKKTNKLVVG